MKVTPYVNVPRRAKELGLVVPTGVAVLPRGFENAASADDLVRESSALTIGKILRNQGVEVGHVQPEGRRLPLAMELSEDWIIPVIFLAPGCFVGSASIVKAVLRTLSEWAKSKRVKASFAVEVSRDGEHVRADYEGPASGLEKLADKLGDLGSGRE